MKVIKSSITIENVKEILSKSYLTGCEWLKLAAFEFVDNPINCKKAIPKDLLDELAVKAIASCLLQDH